MSMQVYKVDGLGERIRKLRVKHKYSQQELAERAGVGRTAIAVYELGSETPTYAKLIKLAGALNVSTDYLLGYDVPSLLDLSGLDDKKKQEVARLVEVMK